MAIIELVDVVTKALDDGENIIGIFIDLSKAFDTIDHGILLKKIEKYGIRGKAMELIRLFLSNRSQVVKYKEETSNRQSITCGVPQGAILSSCLFILFINDLPKTTEKLRFIIFADDTNILASGKDYKALENNVNEELKVLARWFEANKLSLNVTKTNLMSFRNKNSNNIHPTPRITLNGKILERVNRTKFLGVTVDENLDWQTQTRNVIKKVSSALGGLNRAKKVLPTRSLKVLYNSFILPHLTYGLEVWSNSSKTTFNEIKKIQRKAIRIVTKPPIPHQRSLYLPRKI